MISTNIKTVATLYRTNNDIRDLINAWVECRRCPMELVDELLSESMDDAADCALWAATQKERQYYRLESSDLTPSHRSPPYPRKASDKDEWYFLTAKFPIMYYHHVPGLRAVLISTKQLESPLACILDLLNNWRKEKI